MKGRYLPNENMCKLVLYKVEKVRAKANRVLHIESLNCLIRFIIGKQKVYFYFFKRSARYNQQMLSQFSFVCLPLPYMEGIVLYAILIFIV